MPLISKYLCIGTEVGSLICNQTTHKELFCTCYRWFESSRIWAAGLIVGEISKHASHWRAKKSLGSWLSASGVPGLCNVDTRALTCRLREGVTLGRIVQGALPSSPLPPISDPNTRNLVAEVSVKVCINFRDLYRKGPNKAILTLYLHHVSVFCHRLQG